MKTSRSRKAAPGKAKPKQKINGKSPKPKGQKPQPKGQPEEMATEKNCAHCGSPIAKERLKYLPETEYCVRCAARYPEEMRTAEDVCDDLSLPSNELEG